MPQLNNLIYDDPGRRMMTLSRIMAIRRMMGAEGGGIRSQEQDVRGAARLSDFARGERYLEGPPSFSDRVRAGVQKARTIGQALGIIPPEGTNPDDYLAGGGVMGGFRGVRNWNPGMLLAEIPENFGERIPRANPPKLLTEDVQRYLEGRVRERIGEIPATAPDKVKLSRLLSLAKKEANDQLSTPEGRLTADFYETDPVLANNDLTRLFPDLEDPANNTVQKAVSSVMSNNSNPMNEAYWGGRIWREKLKAPGGEIPLTQPGGVDWPARGARKQLVKIQQMRNDLGDKGLADFLMSQQTVADIRRWRPSMEGNATDVVPGALVLGPKIGRYFMDIADVPHQGSTVDVWDVRGNQRRLGRLFSEAGEPIETPTPEPMRDLFMDVHRKIGERHGLKQRQAQSLLWHYEQALYRKLGLPQKSYKRSQGTNLLLKDLLN